MLTSQSQINRWLRNNNDERGCSTTQTNSRAVQSKHKNAARPAMRLASNTEAYWTLPSGFEKDRPVEPRLVVTQLQQHTPSQITPRGPDLRTAARKVLSEQICTKRTCKVILNTLLRQEPKPWRCGQVHATSPILDIRRPSFHAMGCEHPGQDSFAGKELRKVKLLRGRGCTELWLKVDSSALSSLIPIDVRVPAQEKDCQHKELTGC